MPAYDFRAAFERIENELIDSMMRNLRKYHLEEEDALGFDWPQWQVEQLKNLEAYRKRNQKKYGPQFRQINLRIRHAIEHGRVNGQKEEELRILKTMQEHPEWQKRRPFLGNISAEGRSFFKVNEDKLEALLKATQKDMTKAEHAVLRRCNDQYRKIIFDAHVYANSGAGTVAKAVDMATHDFLSRGIDSIVYKNGARHTISDYADMAIRTAERRAYLIGAGEKRQEWGESLVIVNRRGTMTPGHYGSACPQCIQWLGKILIDDVYSGGKPDGKHQLLSTAMKQGFLHPRCKDSFTTYFPGITPIPDPVTKKELKEGAKAEKREAEQQYAERQAEKYERLAENSLDPENKRKYEARAEKWNSLMIGQKQSPETRKYYVASHGVEYAEYLEKVRSGETKLTKRQTRLLEMASKPYNWVQLRSGSVKLKDIAALTAKTGDEFAVFKKGRHKILLHGMGRMWSIPEDLLERIISEKWEWEGHSHPVFGTPRSSNDDRRTLRLFTWQQKSSIINLKGEIIEFTGSEQDWFNRVLGIK